jgi:hypothetical protein
MLGNTRHIGECTKRNSELFHSFIFSLLLAFAIAGLSSREALAESYIGILGGPGGGQFDAPCPSSENLIGFELRAGDDVDAIRPVCGKAYDATNKIVRTKSDDIAWHGGAGGSVFQLLCPAKTPLVLGMDVRAEGRATVVVNNIHLFCGAAVASQSIPQYPSAVFDPPDIDRRGAAFAGFPIKTTVVDSSYASQRCPRGEVAVGLYGRSGVWVDAIGLICDQPRIFLPTSAIGAGGSSGGGSTANREVVKSIGRVSVPKSDASTPALSICARAEDARKRKSPAAPMLVEQCLASGGKLSPP